MTAERIRPDHPTQPRKSPILGAFFSFLVPGAGQMYGGQMLGGGLVLAAWLIGIILFLTGAGIVGIVVIGVVWFTGMFLAGDAVRQFNYWTGNT